MRVATSKTKKLNRLGSHRAKKRFLQSRYPAKQSLKKF